MPPPVGVRLFERRGREYLEVVGRPPPAWTLPSEPPGYVFEKSGRLVSWTYDRGDCPMYLDEWDHFPSVRPVTPKEALAWIDEGAERGP